LRFKELLALLRTRGVDFRVTTIGGFPYLQDTKSGALYPLPELSLNQPVSAHLIDWITAMSGVDPALDLLQDPDQEG
jgi:hypothetical protein